MSLHKPGTEMRFLEYLQSFQVFFIRLCFFPSYNVRKINSVQFVSCVSTMNDLFFFFFSKQSTRRPVSLGRFSTRSWSRNDDLIKSKLPLSRFVLWSRVEAGKHRFPPKASGGLSDVAVYLFMEYTRFCVPAQCGLFVHVVNSLHNRTKSLTLKPGRANRCFREVELIDCLSLNYSSFPDRCHLKAFLWKDSSISVNTEMFKWSLGGRKAPPESVTRI